ncbi:hypothetical protein KJ611_02225 [Patescibacteria group bacterium]|nr:hypothetical protein [Patescibacteria group bacterium]MBU1705528.1 hypothetical protein [Patescibacteria group bacterium]
MNHHEAAEKQTLQKAARRHKKKNPSMKMSGKGLKRFAQPKKGSKS